jgi:hypothetical protein
MSLVASSALATTSMDLVPGGASNVAPSATVQGSPGPPVAPEKVAPDGADGSDRFSTAFCRNRTAPVWAST